MEKVFEYYTKFKSDQIYYYLKNQNQYSCRSKY